VAPSDVTGVATAAGTASGSGIPAYAADVRSDDGIIHHVRFQGRDPKQPDLWVEDSYKGVLPEVGGRYRLVGAQLVDFGGLIILNECIPQAELTVLSPPPLHARVKSQSNLMPAVIGAAGIAVLAAAGALLVRRHRSRLVPS
jgi:hypothetical protein